METHRSVILVKKNKYLKNKKYCKVRYHCRYTNEYGGAVHSICNLKQVSLNNFYSFS